MSSYFCGVFRWTIKRRALCTLHVGNWIIFAPSFCALVKQCTVGDSMKNGPVLGKNFREAEEIVWFCWGSGELLGIVRREAGVEGTAVTLMKTKLFDDIGKELWDNAVLLTNIAAASIKYKSGSSWTTKYLKNLGHTACVFTAVVKPNSDDDSPPDCSQWKTASCTSSFTWPVQHSSLKTSEVQLKLLWAKTAAE